MEFTWKHPPAYHFTGSRLRQQGSRNRCCSLERCQKPGVVGLLPLVLFISFFLWFFLPLSPSPHPKMRFPLWDGIGYLRVILLLVKWYKCMLKPQSPLPMKNQQPVSALMELANQSALWSHARGNGDCRSSNPLRLSFNTIDQVMELTNSPCRCPVLARMNGIGATQGQI